jgi:protease-4
LGLLKSGWRVLVAIKDGLVLLFLLLFFALVYAGLKFSGEPPAVPSSGALFLKLEGPIVEQPAEVDSVSRVAGGETVRETRLRDLVHAIETAAGDRSIKAVVIDAGLFGGGGQVAMMRVGQALDKVRAAKKPVLIRSGLYDDDGYMLAAHASEVWLDPLGMVGVTGPGGSNLYYKGLIDKLGANVHVYRVGTYKSFVEPYIRADQSEPAREASQALVSAVWGNWLDEVEKARAKGKIRAYVADPAGASRANGGDMAKAALAAGLVDKLGDEGTFEKRVAEIAGEGRVDKGAAFSAISLRQYLARNPLPTSGGVAVVTVAGDIVDGEAGSGMAGGASVADLIHQAINDDATKAIVLRVDSPGGSVTGAETIRAALMEAKAAKLPIVVSMGNVAASGGYWVSTTADRIFAEPSTITGSIGVFGIIPSFETTLAKAGITTDGVKATPLSGEPNVVGGISPEFDALAQASVEDIYRRFVGLVAQARKMTPEKVDGIAQGRVWDGGTARQLGLVDQFGGLEDAVAVAAKLAGVSGSEAQARYIDPEPDKWAAFFDQWTSDDARLGLAGAARARAGQMNWLDVAADRQRALAARIIGDVQAMVDGPAVRVDCLECRSFAPPARVSGPVQPSMLIWLSRLSPGYSGT